MSSLSRSNPEGDQWLDNLYVTDADVKVDQLYRALAAASQIEAPHENWTIEDGSFVQDWITEVVDEARQYVANNPKEEETQR